MTDLIQIGVLFLIALFLTGVFVLLLRQPGPWRGFVSFFWILFLGIWLSVLWIPPLGPLLWGVAWIPPLVVGILLALILIMITPLLRRRKRDHFYYDEPRLQQRRQDRGIKALNRFYWGLLLLLITGLILSQWLIKSA